VQIAFDDKRRMTERVLRLQSGFAYSQDPPSRTVHLIGNVRVRGEVDGELDVASSLSIAEVRRGQQRVYYARVVHRLVDGDDGLRIRRKEVHLANSDLPLGNVTFLI
jgi:benzoate/toluate 1,2-dioxygenase beta subunit